MNRHTKEAATRPVFEILLSIFILGCGAFGVFVLDAVLTYWRPF